MAKLRLVFQDEALRRRILFTLGILALFRLGASIPIPGVNVAALENFLSTNQFFGLLDIFSGGGLSSLSIMMLGVGPYITASIIMQLMTLMFPRLKQMYQEEGEAGRRKISQYSRYLTVPLAIIQGYSLFVILQRAGILNPQDVLGQATNLAVIVAGSLLLTWMGELISEYGLGNGVSLIIFAGIVARFPYVFNQLRSTFEASQAPLYLALAAASVLIVAGVVYVTEAERPIPVTYAKRVRGMKMYGGMSTYLPIRVNNAGVMPIIFALSILLFPQMIANFLSGIGNDWVRVISDAVNGFLSNPWAYGIFYFVLVVAFTYFYSAVTFDPDAISTNLQKNGAFIPGVRPGNSTASYLGRILSRLTLVGALFLGIVALLPIIIQDLTGMQSIYLGGTSLLIVVSVALEFAKQINAQISMREY